MHIVCLGQFIEARIDPQVDHREIVVVGEMLILAHQSQNVIADHDDLGADAIIFHRCQFHHGHLEPAVSADSDHLSSGLSKLCPHGSRNSISHGSHTAAGKEPASPDHTVCAGPELVLADVRNIDRILLHLCREFCNKCRRIDQALSFLIVVHHGKLDLGRLFGEAFVPVFIQDKQPLRSIDLDLFLQEALENISDIADQRDRRTGVFPDLSGVYIDVDQDLAVHDKIGLGDRSVCDPGSDHDDHVRAVHRLISVSSPIITDHAVKQRMVCRHNADSHHRADDRDLISRSKSPYLLHGICQVHASAGADDRSFCLDELLHDLAHLDGMS